MRPGPADLALRPVTSQDLVALADLERALFGADAWSEALLRAELDGPGRRCVVAVVDGEPAGYAVTMLVGDVADLQRVAVRRDRQRTGVARMLLRAVLDRARADGAERVLLEVGAGNEAALALYTDSGFVEVTRRRRYYRDGTDAVVLERPLGGAAGGGGRMGG